MKVKIGIIGGTGLDNSDLIEKRSEKNVETPYGLINIVEGKISGIDCVRFYSCFKFHVSNYIEFA